MDTVHMKPSDLVRLVREVSGEEDVEFVQILPAKVRYKDQALHPLRIVRRGERYFVEAVEYPGEWWMGEMEEGCLVVWGSYGALSEAAGQH